MQAFNEDENLTKKRLKSYGKGIAGLESAVTVAVRGFEEALEELRSTLAAC